MVAITIGLLKYISLWRGNVVSLSSITMVEVWLELMIFQTVNLKGRIPRDRSHKWILYQAGILLNACPRQFRLNFSAFIDMLKEQQCRLTTLCQGTNVQQGREYWYLLICNSIQMSATS